MMISIEGLLEDEQGLSMGEMLTVKIRQPSHEFTFGVGISKHRRKTTILKSSNLSRRWPRPTLAATASLHGCAMVEFTSYAFIIIGMASVVMV
jgi:hypothetical protein